LQWPIDEHRNLVTRKNRIGVLTRLLAVWIGTAVAEELTFPTTENKIFKILSLAQGFPASLLCPRSYLSFDFTIGSGKMYNLHW
jgi:hypothetical protein